MKAAPGPSTGASGAPGQLRIPERTAAVSLGRPFLSLLEWETNPSALMRGARRRSRPSRRSSARPGASALARARHHRAAGACRAWPPSRDTDRKRDSRPSRHGPAARSMPCCHRRAAKRKPRVRRAARRRRPDWRHCPPLPRSAPAPRAPGARPLRHRYRRTTPPRHRPPAR